MEGDVKPDRKEGEDWLYVHTYPYVCLCHTYNNMMSLTTVVDRDGCPAYSGVNLKLLVVTTTLYIPYHIEEFCLVS